MKSASKKSQGKSTESTSKPSPKKASASQQAPSEAAPTKAAPKKVATKKAALAPSVSEPAQPAAKPATSKAPAAATSPAETPKKKKKAKPAEPQPDPAQLLDSKVVYQGPLFRVQQDHIIEPGGRESHRDVIRHNGSVVILAVDPGKKKKDPWIVIERQYRHAAGQFLWELPAGKLDAGETPRDGAKRELSEETGYQARKWSPLITYFASPGFLGESMKVFLAEGLVAGDAHPEEDEHIDFRLVKLSELLELIDKGKIVDGKTLTSILFYARVLGIKR
jgi:ADP-ribose pyrophosphatase